MKTTGHRFKCHFISGTQNLLLGSLYCSTSDCKLLHKKQLRILPYSHHYTVEHVLYHRVIPTISVGSSKLKVKFVHNSRST